MFDLIFKKKKIIIHEGFFLENIINALTFIMVSMEEMRKVSHSLSCSSDDLDWSRWISCSELYLYQGYLYIQQCHSKYSHMISSWKNKIFFPKKMTINFFWFLYFQFCKKKSGNLQLINGHFTTLLGHFLSTTLTSFTKLRSRPSFYGA